MSIFNLSYFRKKYFLGILRRWCWLLIIFGILLIIYLFWIWFYFDFNDDDYHNWFVSFSGSLLFFAIGLFTAILGSRLPQEESFAIRTSALLNGKYANKDAERFLVEKVKELMTYTKEYSLTLTLKKLNKDKTHVYLHIESQSKLANMCEDEEIELSVKGHVLAGLDLDGSFGLVTHHSVKRNNFPEKFFIDEGHIVNLNDLSEHKYEIDRKVPIYANSISTLMLCYEIWVPLNGNFVNEDDFFYHGFPIFTEQALIQMKNEMPNKIGYEYKIKGKRYVPVIDNSSENIQGGIINAKDKKVIVSKSTFEKDDQFEVIFTTNKEKP